jgi:hypothetical protein
MSITQKQTGRVRGGDHRARQGIDHIEWTRALAGGDFDNRRSPHRSHSRRRKHGDLWPHAPGHGGNDRASPRRPIVRRHAVTCSFGSGQGATHPSQPASLNPPVSTRQSQPAVSTRLLKAQSVGVTAIDTPQNL